MSVVILQWNFVYLDPNIWILDQLNASKLNKKITVELVEIASKQKCVVLRLQDC